MKYTEADLMAWLNTLPTIDTELLKEKIINGELEEFILNQEENENGK